MLHLRKTEDLHGWIIMIVKVNMYIILLYILIFKVQREPESSQLGCVWGVQESLVALQLGDDLVDCGFKKHHYLHWHPQT